MQKFLLGLILSFAFLARFYQVAEFPAGFNPDEAGQGYTAYSLLKTGKDEWGESFPLAPRSYGDYRAPLYTYLTVPFVAIFGLNEFAVRLPNVIIGTAAIFVVYLLSRKLIEKNQTSKKVPLYAALLLAISPWHISLSRGAFEANLPILLLPLGVWLFLHGLERPRYMLGSALVFGLSLFSYYSARFVVPLLLFALILWKVPKFQWPHFLQKHFMSVFVLGVFATLVLTTMFAGGGTRASDVVIFSPTDSWGAVADRRFEAVLIGLNDSFARVFSNKATYLATQFINNYLSYLSPQFLFTNGAGEATYGMSPGVGLLYLVELPFFILGIVLAVKQKLDLSFLVIWMLLAIIPAALAKGPGYAANRAAIMLPAVQIMTSLGLVSAFLLLAKRINPKILSLGLIAVFSLSFLFFAENYFFHAPNKNSRSMSYGWKQAMFYIKDIEGQYGQIVISKKFSEPQMYVAFYKQLDPKIVQEASGDWLRYEKEGKKFVDQLGEYTLEKYVFKNFNYDAENGKNILLVGKPEDFPEKISILHKIYYPDGKDAIWIVDAKASVLARNK